MTGRDLAAVAFRVWGMVLLLSSVAAAPAVLLAARVSTALSEQAALIRATNHASIAQLLASVILGLVLLIWAEPLAHWAVPSTPSVELGVDAGQLLSVGLAVVGAFILIDGLATAAGIGYLLARKPRWAEQAALSYGWERQPDAMIRAAVNVIAGLLLALGRTGMVAAWLHIKSYALRGRGPTIDADDARDGQ